MKEPKERKEQRKQQSKHKEEHRKNIRTTNIIIMGLSALVVLSLAYFFLFRMSGTVYVPVNGGDGNEPAVTTTKTAGAHKDNCGDIEVDVGTMFEASNYYRVGVQRPATDGKKFVVFEIRVKNNMASSKDLSGYRMELLVGGSTYIPLRFNNIEKVKLTSGSDMDYACEELPLAYVSSYELAPGETLSGCKIFEILSGAKPDHLNLYDSSDPTGMSACSLTV